MPKLDIDSSVRLDGKTVIVTGCNTGIGKETVRELAKRGARIIMACRSLSRTEPTRTEIVAESKNDQIVFKELDLSSIASVRAFAEAYNREEDRLDILINNAGVATSDRKTTVDGHEMMFGTNHLGHFLLTNLLLDKLKQCSPSRIVTVSSLGHERNPLQLNDLESEKSFNALGVYSNSKSANLLFSFHLAKLLEGTGVTTYALHPGTIRTGLMRPKGALASSIFWCIMPCIATCCYCDPLRTRESGAMTTLYCALEPSLANVSGRYYSDCKEKQPKPHAVDPHTAEKLWQISTQLCAL